MAPKRIDGGTVEIGGICLPVEVRVNPRARRLIMRLGRERTVHVTCPSTRHVRQALAMVKERRAWLLARLSETPDPVPFAEGEILPVLGTEHRIIRDTNLRRAARLEGDRIITGGATSEAMARRVERLLRIEAEKACREQAQHFARQLDVTIGRVSVRQMTSRWGSCAADGNLSFNWRLVLAPPFVLRYVVAHEVAHRLYMDHSENFWAVVKRLDPRHLDAAAWLKANGPGLHAFGQVLEDHS